MLFAAIRLMSHYGERGSIPTALLRITKGGADRSGVSNGEQLVIEDIGFWRWPELLGF